MGGLFQLFLRQATATPQALALNYYPMSASTPTAAPDSQATLTYAALLKRSMGLAAVLRAKVPLTSLSSPMHSPLTLHAATT